MVHVDNGASWTSIPMDKISWITFQATIPGFKQGTCICYNIVAYDAAGNKAENNNNNYYYTYTVVPEHSFTTILAILIFQIIFIITFRRKKTKLPSL